MTIREFLEDFYSLSPTIARERRKPLHAFMLAMVLANSWCLIFFAYFQIADSWIAYLNLVYLAIGVGLIHMLKTRGNETLWVIIFSAQLVSMLNLCIYQFGWEGGFQYPLLTTFIFTFLAKYKSYWFPITVSIFNFAALMAGYYFFQYNPDRPDYSEQLIQSMHFTNILVTALGLSIMAILYQIDTHNSELEVSHEKQKSEDLLHNILPVSIADRLKEDQTIIADGFENVSVMFADIVGFTQMSQEKSPSELVTQLNAVFTEFDNLAEHYSLEKIKTIGDAYMVSGGLPEHDPQHLSKMANMALDMQRIMKETPELGDMEIRIGMHAGPVVAGVIGVKKFAYDLWGDTVNTASRMESHGLPGKINVTETVVEQLKGQFQFEERGEIEIKGKGKMKGYLLVGGLS
jgi:class 3 adenylate cyclase